MAFYLTHLAIADLKDIGRYTQKQWGVRQRNIYLSALDNVFHFLDVSPDRGIPCDEIRPGYLKYRVHKHVIYYRKVDDEDIEIVRILHGSMDTGPYSSAFVKRILDADKSAKEGNVTRINDAKDIWADIL